MIKFDSLKFYLKKLRRVLVFIFFPSSIKLKNNQAQEGSFDLEIKQIGLPLVICFAGLGGKFNFKKTFSNQDVNVIYLRDLKHNWYLNGLPEVGQTVEEITSYLLEKINLYKPSKVITIGSSAGGFAAILYGIKLEADKVIAFSPQSFMNKLNCVLYLDYRWLDRVIQIYKGDNFNRRFLDLKPMVKDVDVPIEIIFDATHHLDSLHAKRLNGKSITHKLVMGGGHAVVKLLRNTSYYEKLINEIVKS